MSEFSFHLQARFGTRNGGASAEVAASYKCRIGTTSRRKDLVAVVSGNMPMWSYETGTPLEKAAGMDFWKATDRFERANGRLFLDYEVSLPSFFSLTQQKNLLDDFLKIITRVEAGFLPYTFAIHGPAGKKWKNIHAHIQMSEKAYDGNERNPELWFKRAANGGGPNGGAPKADEPKRKVWFEFVRETWAKVCNEHLERFGSDVRIDHRSYADRGIELMPTAHVGPKGRNGYSPEQLEIISSNSEIRKANAELIRLAEEQKTIDAEVADLLRERQECEVAEAAMRAVENQGSKRPTFGKRPVGIQGETKIAEVVKTAPAVVQPAKVDRAPEVNHFGIKEPVVLTPARLPTMPEPEPEIWNQREEKPGAEIVEAKPRVRVGIPNRLAELHRPGGPRKKKQKIEEDFVVRAHFDSSHMAGGIRTSSRVTEAETGGTGTGVKRGEGYGT